MAVSRGTTTARYFISRALWFLPMLLGITLVTFVVLDWLPVDREVTEVAASMPNAGEAKRALAVRQLRVELGMLDPVTFEPIPVWERYLHWLESVARFDLRSTYTDPAVFRARFGDALTISAMLGLASISIALVLGIVLGTWLGMRRGALADRAVGSALMIGYSLPEFLIATFLLLTLGGAWFEPVLFPGGLRSEGAEAWSITDQWIDLLGHLVMPITTLLLVPLAIVTRHVREAVGRAVDSEHVAAMRNWGLPESAIRRSVMRHGLAPVATLVGTMLPATIGGSVVVERVFAIPGLGKMAFDAVLDKDVGVVMALTLLGASVTLVALTLSDVLHRRVDARVSLR